MKAALQMEPRRPGSVPGRTVLAAIVVALIASCASLEFERQTATSGTFESTAWSFTFLGFDLPTSALKIARANAADAAQPNTEPTYESVTPYLWIFDFLLDIFGVRYAVVRGTWGYPDAAPATSEAAR